MLRNVKKGKKPVVDQSNVLSETGYYTPLLEHLRLLFLN
jgi:hypothetical protein